ncbi:MAG: hypothetical protein EU549_03210 [Promethearchaeota archaeon]|nr:MAG: hypothetical protein EU549_03210 [Candidatus Lokiarchaeota archaeon]
MSDLIKSLKDAKFSRERQSIKFILSYILKIFLYRNWLYKKYRKDWKFIFKGEKYRYFHHLYNMTWENERAVELPIIKSILTRYKGRNILELGNVLSHYFNINHDIIDKYENRPGIINKDIISFDTNKKYDLIISISTLEHIGYDEYPRDPSKIAKTIKKLRDLKKENGEIVITFPTGYNPYLDSFIKSKKIQFDEIYYMKRLTKDNRWKEVKDLNKIINLKFGEPYPNANGLIVAFIK